MADAPKAEHRQISILFCDWDRSGPTDCSDMPDHILLGYQDICARVTLRFEGHIKQSSAHGFQAYFGYPLAREDNAQRAVRAGLSILRTLPHNDRSVRIGVHTSWALLGGLHQQIALDMVPNLAVLLGAGTCPGSLTICTATYHADLRMMQQMLPPRLRRYGLKIVPRIYMQQLIGKDGCRRVGIKPVMGLFILRWLLRQLPRLWMKPWAKIDERHRNLHETLSRLLFQGLINREYGSEVSFSVPETLADLKKLV